MNQKKNINYRPSNNNFEMFHRWNKTLHKLDHKYHHLDPNKSNCNCSVCSDSKFMEELAVGLDNYSRKRGY